MSVVDVVELCRYEVLTYERERDVLVARGDPGWLGVSAPRPHIDKCRRMATSSHLFTLRHILDNNGTGI